MRPKVNKKSNDEHQQRRKSAIKRNYLPHELSSPNLVQFDDQDTKDSTKNDILEENRFATQKEVTNMNQNYVARFGQMEKIVSNVMEKMRAFEEEMNMKCNHK